jgi:glycosyltransferase involved in cell wall biosynthesis
MCRALQELGVDLLLATTDAGQSKHSLSEENRVVTGRTSAQDSSLSKDPTPRCKLQTRNNYQDVPTIFFPVQLGQSFKYSRPFAKWLDEHVAEFDVVHIHAVFNHACIAAARACSKNKVPYIIRPLGTLDPWSMKQKKLRKRVFWNAGVKKMLTGAAVIHYTAPHEQKAVEESLNLNHGVVVPLGVDIRGKSEVVSDLTKKSSFLQNVPYVLVLSRLLPTKGLDVLVEAFLSLVKRPPLKRWRLVLAGEGPANYLDSLKRMIGEQDAMEFVVFTGWLDGEEKEAALTNASLLALPSYHENFGLCVMESLACGVPVLISPHVNLAPDIRAAGAGWVAEVNKDSLVKELAEALSSEEERLRRGEAGRNLALNFAWPKVAEKLFDLYTLAAAGKS